MRNTQSITLFLLLTISTFCQNSTQGIYFFTSHDVVQRLNLMSDSKSLLTINSRGNKTEYVGNWTQKNDTVIIIERALYLPTDSLQIISDTLYFNVFSPTCLKRFFKNESYMLSFKKQVEYYEKGNIKFEIKGFNSYPLTGIITYHYENGKINEIINYKNGKKHGQYLKYNNNGILVLIGCWRRDKEIGKWKYYDDNGILLKIINNNR